MTAQEDARTLPITLELLAENERAIATLYEEYSARFPAQSAFWAGLANDERQHAAWIQELRMLDPVHPATSSSRFTAEAIRTFTSYVHEQTNEVRARRIQPSVALSTAYFIETALIERRFFEQLPADKESVRSVMSLLVRSTQEHVNKVKDASHKGGPGGT